MSAKKSYLLLLNPCEREVFGDPLDTIWKNCIFGLCGVTNVQRRVFGIVVTSSAKERAGWIREVAETIDWHFPA